jgi:NADH-quinone oxidoreductase subunit G
MPKLTIDGKQIDVVDGTTVIQAAEQAGIEIPHYCYHPDLPIDGNCRMCLVEVEKMPKLTPACATVASEGMIVRTNNDRVKEAVRGVLEFLLINHPVDCPVCDQAGECRLQDYYMVYGLHTSEIPLDMKVRKHKAVDLGPMVVLDSERCVLCSRCIRFFNHVTGTGEMQFFGRGDHVEIGTLENRPLTNPYSGNVVDICPVGALTSRDFRFKCRVWFLLSTDSICGGCSTGCNVRIDHRDGTIFRMIARRNVDVNKSWMCDEGRLSFHALQRGERVVLPAARGRDGMQAPVTWEQAIRAADGNLKDIVEQSGPASIVGIASPSATNEALFLFKRYITRGLGAHNVEFRLDSEDLNAVKAEDDVLRRVDKHPNSIGAKNLALYSAELGSIDGAIAAARAGRFKAGLIMYLKPLVSRAMDDEHEAKVADLVRSLEYSVVLAAHKAPWLKDGGLVLPVAHWSEEDGSYTNYQGREQAAYAPIAPEPEILPIWQVMSMLLEARGEASVWTSPSDVRSMMESEKMESEKMESEKMESEKMESEK